MISNKKLLLFLGLCILVFAGAKAQNFIDVAEITIKVNAHDEELRYYGFAEGDQILFSYDELDDKEISEVQVMEYPDKMKYSAKNTRTVKMKTITVPKTGVYVFKFLNQTFGKNRNIKVKIQRIAASSATKLFDNSVSWVDRMDTLEKGEYKTIDKGKKQVTVEKTRRVLDKIDTTAIQVLDRMETVHSRTSMGNTNTAIIRFKLPENEFIPDRKNPLETREVHSWAYWIGVGKEGEQQYEQANKNLVLNGLKGLVNIAQQTGVLTGGYGALASLALQGVSMFIKPTGGDNVKYQVGTLDKKGVPVLLDQGDGPVAYARLENPKQGEAGFILTNDNYVTPIDVHIKVVAIRVVKKFKDEVYTILKEEPVIEKVTIKEPVLKSVKVPICNGSIKS